jgi:hypothetical protein
MKIRLIPNPYVYIDAQGLAVGTHPHAPVEGAHPQRRVAARVAGSVVAKANPIAGELGKAYAAAGVDVHQAGGNFGVTPIVQDTVWEHDGVEEVENTPDGFYARACCAGDLFAADAESAEAMGITFADPYLGLADARRKAGDVWAANHKGKRPAFEAQDCPVAACRPGRVAVPKAPDSVPHISLQHEEVHS